MAESIFTDQVPALTNANDSTAYTLATLFTPAVNGAVTHIRWRFPDTSPSAPVVGALYSRTSDAAGTELSRATFASPVAGTWNTAELPSPVNISVGGYYYTAVWTPDRYVATGGFFTSTALTTGNLTAPADDTVTPRRNGRFNDFGVEPNYPDFQFDGGGYFVDVVFEAAGGAVANPQHVVLSSDTQQIITLDANYGQVEITVVANPAVIFFNVKDEAIGTVAGAVDTMDGHQVGPAALWSKIVRDETSGTVSKVRLRSAGTPTVSVRGL